MLTKLRVRSKLDKEAMDRMVGRMVEPDDISVRLGPGPAFVMKPDGSPLAVYLPGALLGELRDNAWATLHELKNSYTENRGMASGGTRVNPAGDKQRRSRARYVDSAIIGSFDPAGPKQYCRLTAWTGKENEKWRGLWPTFQEIGRLLAEFVPERFEAQMREVRRTDPFWLVPGTPFTTITVNNTYATAVHTDKGDLEAGFSTLAVLRRGDYEGGWLCFPEWGVGVDMQDGDVLLMDAHEWHGNTPMVPEPERDFKGRLLSDPGYERISIVCYYRTKMTECGSAADEEARRRVYAENRQAAAVGE